MTLEPAKDGFVWCDECGQVQPAPGHRCGELQPSDNLLCALAFDHKRELWVPPELGAPDVEGHDGFWLDCQVAVGERRCVFCDAEFDYDERNLDESEAAKN